MSDMLVNYGSLDTLAAAMAQGSSQSQADLDAMDAELRPPRAAGAVRRSSSTPFP